MSDNPLLDAALQYAGLHWRVFRLLPGRKIPFKGSRGFHDGTSDRRTVEALWSESPEANIGLATGQQDNGPNLAVLDADGPEGLAAFQALARRHQLPRTFTARTPRGGWHFYYRLPAGHPLRSFNVPRAHKGGPGLDLKADKGLVVLPPSRGKGGTYSWVFLPATGEPAELPLSAVMECLTWGGSRRPASGGVDPRQAAPASGALGPPPAWLTPPATGGELRSATSILEKSFFISDLPDFLQALKDIPASCSYDRWFEIGAAIHEFAPGADGLSIFQAWSRTSPGHLTAKDQEDCAGKWLEYARRDPQAPRITRATVFKLAQEARAETSRRVLDPPEAGNPPPVGSGRAAPAAGPPEGQVPAANEEVNGSAFALPEALTAKGPIFFPDVDHKNRPRQTCRNARVAIRELGLSCEHDTFHGRMAIGGQAIGQWAGELTDDAVQMLRVVIERQFHFDPGLTAAHDAAIQECLLCPFNPVADYFDALAWDGVARLDTWMVDYLGAELTPFNCAVSRLALVAAVRRVRCPGAKFDQIIVLESPEGHGKSSAIEILAGSKNFSDQSILNLDDRGQQEALQGVLLYEIADLAHHSRAEVERVKAFASRTSDRARPAYGRARVDRPRQCIFFATTNSDTYLKSQTGNRRFWPVRCGHIDLAALRRDRDQLWAEAAGAERGAILTLPERLWGEATLEQDSRRDRDPWEDILYHVKGKTTADGREERIASRDLMEIHLKLPSERQNDVTAKRLCFAMRRLGWSGPRVYREDKITLRGYTRKPVVTA